MNIVETSQEFDVLYNNIKSDKAPGVDEYEKSVFLTLAQEEIIKSFYNNSGSSDNKEINKEINKTLIKSTTLIPTIITDSIFNYNDVPYIYSIDTINDIWFLLYETATINDPNSPNYINNKNITVRAENFDSIAKNLNNPFKTANNRYILRCVINDNNHQNILLSSYKLSKYNSVYLKKPYPIILFDTTKTEYIGLSIDGKKVPFDTTTINFNEKNPFEVSEVIQRLILQSAVELAVKTYADRLSGQPQNYANNKTS